MGREQNFGSYRYLYELADLKRGICRGMMQHSTPVGEGG